MFAPTVGRFTGKVAITTEYIRSFRIFFQRTVITDCDKTDVFKTYRGQESRTKKLAPNRMQLYLVQKVSNTADQSNRKILA